MANIEKISYVELDDFEVRTDNYNKETKKNDIIEYMPVSKAYAVLGVKPNWLQIVVHRAHEDYKMTSRKSNIDGIVEALANPKIFKKDSIWVVSEMNTTGAIFIGIDVEDDNGKQLRVRSREDAVLFALESIERHGKESVLGSMALAKKTIAEQG